MRSRKQSDENAFRQAMADLHKIRRVVARENIGCFGYALIISLIPALLYGAYRALKAAGWWF